MKKDLESSGNHYNLQLVNENKNSNSEPQSNSNNLQETKIIQCISRILTATERKYSQIELEALAPVWAVERLNLYTLGRKFK